MPRDPGASYQPNPDREVYLLPAATQFETAGSCTASNRSLQWRERVIEPLFDSRSDQAICTRSRRKWGSPTSCSAGGTAGRTSASSR